MSTHRNEPVYPTCAVDLDEPWSTSGITKREYFAALALAAEIAAERRRPLEDQCSLDDLANVSVIAADALIAALNAEPQR